MFPKVYYNGKVKISKVVPQICFTHSDKTAELDFKPNMNNEKEYYYLVMDRYGDTIANVSNV